MDLWRAPVEKVGSSDGDLRGRRGSQANRGFKITTRKTVSGRRPPSRDDEESIQEKKSPHSSAYYHFSSYV